MRIQKVVKNDNNKRPVTVETHNDEDIDVLEIDTDNDPHENPVPAAPAPKHEVVEVKKETIPAEDPLEIDVEDPIAPTTETLLASKVFVGHSLFDYPDFQRGKITITEIDGETATIVITGHDMDPIEDIVTLGVPFKVGDDFLASYHPEIFDYVLIRWEKTPNVTDEQEESMIHEPGSVVYSTDTSDVYEEYREIFNGLAQLQGATVMVSYDAVQRFIPMAIVDHEDTTSATKQGILLAAVKLCLASMDIENEFEIANKMVIDPFTNIAYIQLNITGDYPHEVLITDVVIEETPNIFVQVLDKVAEVIQQPDPTPAKVLKALSIPIEKKEPVKHDVKFKKLNPDPEPEVSMELTPEQKAEVLAADVNEGVDEVTTLPIDVEARLAELRVKSRNKTITAEEKEEYFSLL